MIHDPTRGERKKRFVMGFHEIHPEGMPLFTIVSLYMWHISGGAVLPCQSCLASESTGMSTSIEGLGTEIHIFQLASQSWQSPLGYYWNWTRCRWKMPQNKCFLQTHHSQGAVVGKNKAFQSRNAMDLSRVKMFLAIFRILRKSTEHSAPNFQSRGEQGWS